MKRFLALWGLAILLACATQPTPLSAAACPTTTSAAILAAFAQGGIEPTAHLKDTKARALRAWLVETYEARIQVDIDEAILYVANDEVMVLWFWQGCFQGHGQGPWDPVREHLGL